MQKGAMQYAIAYDNNTHFIRLKMELHQLNPLNSKWLLKFMHFFFSLLSLTRLVPNNKIQGNPQ